MRTRVGAAVAALSIALSACAVDAVDAVDVVEDHPTSGRLVFGDAPLAAIDGDLPPPVPIADEPERTGPVVHELPPREIVEPTAPTRVHIPSIGVSALLDAVGLEPDGAMEIPHDVARVGWYELGVVPGAAEGTAVLSGHVDSRTQGRGALWPLKDTAVGAVIEVSHDDGAVSRWQVTDRRSYLKSELPIPELFTRFGPARLAIITCGGTFDRSRGSYTHNVVVIAEPVPDA